VSWRVDAGKVDGGKRYVRQFQTRAEAEQHAEELRAQRAEARETESFERKHRAVKLTHLSDEQRADALAAFRVLDGTGGTLKAAALFWKEHAAPADARTVNDLHKELIEATERANRRPRTVYELRNKLAGFTEQHGRQPAAQITTPDVEQWLNSHTRRMKPRSRAAYRQALHRLFAYAVKRGYRTANPVAAIEKPHADETTPEVLTPEQVRRLLNTAAAKWPAMVPYLAIGFFAGLRSTEIDGLRWQSIDFQRRQILVSAATAKKRRTRYVKMEPALSAWLADHRETEGPIFYSRRYMRRVEEQGGVKVPHNGARHSFGSYHLAAFEDAGRTAAQMGHTDDHAMLFNHYRALVKPSEAREYWKIKPTTKEAGKVLPFPRAAAG
jgi:integrase